jgi:hypothetical protein
MIKSEPEPVNVVSRCFKGRTEAVMKHQNHAPLTAEGL